MTIKCKRIVKLSLLIIYCDVNKPDDEVQQHKLDRNLALISADNTLFESDVLTNVVIINLPIFNCLVSCPIVIIEGISYDIRFEVFITSI